MWLLMGRGNCRTTGECEGLYYVDNDYLWMYCHKDEPDDTRLLKDVPYGEMDKIWLFDEDATMAQNNDFRECFFGAIHRRFPSFYTCDKWVGWRNERTAVMENRLFYICIENNEGSLAIELIQKDDVGSLCGLQYGLYQKFLDGIRDALFEQFETLGVYAGAWTHGTIRRKDYVRNPLAG